MDTQLNNLVN